MSQDVEKKLARVIQKERRCDYTAGLMALRRYIADQIARGLTRSAAIQEAREAVIQKRPALFDLVKTSVAS